MGYCMRQYQSGCIKITVVLSLCLFNMGYVQAESCKGGTPSTLKLGGVVKTKATYNLQDLKNFRLDAATEYIPTKVTVTFNTSSGSKTGTYTGVLLNDLLAAATVKVNAKQKNDILRKYVVAHASDCYEAIIALGEILPRFENKKIIVAYADGEGNALPDSEGFVRLVVPGDSAGGRNVTHLSQLTVNTAGK